MSTFTDWARVAEPRRFLTELLALPAIDEAIFIASPSLHVALATWRNKPDSPAGQRAEHALAKYVARMAGRSTPFGLFAGISTGTLGQDTKLELVPRGEYHRRTRLDNDYLFVLAEQLGRAHRDVLVVRPTTSLYRIGGRLRYAAAYVRDKERRYQLVSVEPTPYLEMTLARASVGARIAELAEVLVTSEVTLDEARAYVDELVEAQLLVPELSIHVTGPEPIDGMLDQLRVAGIDSPTLANARRAIGDLDAAGIGNPPETYRAIAQSLEVLPAKVELARLFQVDMIKPATVTISRQVATDTLQAVQKLARITASNRTLDDFRRAFADRWEAREVPLTDVLDEESGIGFEVSRVPGAECSPLLAGIGMPGGPPDIRVSWTAREAHQLKLLAGALATGADEIALDTADFDAMAEATAARLPDAFAVMTRLAATPEQLARGDVTISLEGSSGPSGGKLLGRFCHASPQIEAIVRAHHADEEALHPSAVFAEIVHLNEGRIGNILCRPQLRAHEIVYLGVSGALREQQITLDDLTVAVRGDRIVLRSTRLDKEIIPRLTTAHNFRKRSLGVYRFLCVLANQGATNVGWSWGPLARSPRLPRVRAGRVVLSPQTWNLDERDLAPITAAKAAPARAVAALREARRLPRYVVIAAGDNELPIDLDNPMLVAAFADELAGEKQAQLHEMFPTPDRLVARGPEGGFSNEVVLTFTRRGAPAPATPRTPLATVPRRFVPGGEWLYAKIYAGESTGDRVLRALAPVIRAHDGPWFFIRYSDPDPHIRVRFHGEPGRLLATIPTIEAAIAPMLAVGAVRKLVLDSYERELERYYDIETVEQIFWRDSEAVLGIVELLDGDAGADARWRLALRGIDSLLEAIGLTSAQREVIVTNGRDNLGREMRADTALWRRIGERFAKERASLDLLFARDPARDAGHDLEPGFELLARRDAAIQVIDVSKLPITDVGWSLVHMHANRLLHASQRAQELVLYDFLRRLHVSARIRTNSSAEPNR